MVQRADAALREVVGSLGYVALGGHPAVSALELLRHLVHHLDAIQCQNRSMQGQDTARLYPCVASPFRRVNMLGLWRHRPPKPLLLLMCSLRAFCKPAGAGEGWHGAEKYPVAAAKEYSTLTHACNTATRG